MGPSWHHKGAMIPLQGLHRDWQFYLEVKAKVVNRRLNVPIIIIILWLLWLLLLQQAKSNLRMNVTRGTLRWSFPTEMIQGKRALIRGPRLKTLCAEVHSRRHFSCLQRILFCKTCDLTTTTTTSTSSRNVRRVAQIWRWLSAPRCSSWIDISNRAKSLFFYFFILLPSVYYLPPLQHKWASFLS